MAELLARHGRQAVAEELFVAALEANDLAPERRFGLLCRRAAVAKGRQRWELLLEAARIVPAGSPGRRQCLDAIDTELTDRSQAEVAAQLAAGAEDPELKAAILLVEARLHVSMSQRADAYLRVLQARPAARGADPRGVFRLELGRRASAGDRIGRIATARGAAVEPGGDGELETAYRAAGRDDARRAASDDPETSDRAPRITRSQCRAGRWNVLNGFS